MRYALLLFATVMVVGCDSGLNRTADAASSDRIIGVWDARFRLDEPLMRSDASLTKDVEGEIAFVGNRFVPRLNMDNPAPSAYGTYDVDFSPFGFDPRPKDGMPSAFAWRANDSVKIVLGFHDSETSIAMDGLLRGDSATGRWSVSVGRTGGGGGRFVIARHR